MRPHCILSASRPYRKRLAKLLASKFVPSAQNEADRLLICPRTVQARRRAPSLIGLDVAHGSTASKLKTLGAGCGSTACSFI